MLSSAGMKRKHCHTDSPPLKKSQPVCPVGHTEVNMVSGGVVFSAFKYHPGKSYRLADSYNSMSGI